MALDFDQVSGDAFATVQVMMAYYKHTSRAGNRGKLNQSKIQTDNVSENEDAAMAERIQKELESSTLSSFAAKFDSVCKSALVTRFIDFSNPRSKLLSGSEITDYYRMLCEDFPICHFVFATSVSARWSTVETDVRLRGGTFSDGEESLKTKRRRIVSLFLDMLRTRSQQMLPHYSMVKPLGHWSKGIQESRGALFDKLREIYARCLPTFNDKLCSILRAHAAFDNHNCILGLMHLRCRSCRANKEEHF